MAQLPSAGPRPPRTPFVDWDQVFRVADGQFNCKRIVLSNDRGIMAGEMLQKPTRGRLLTALRIALYPAFESAEARGFQALTMEAENARGSGDWQGRRCFIQRQLLKHGLRLIPRICAEPATASRASTKSSADIVKRNASFRVSSKRR